MKCRNDQRNWGEQVPWIRPQLSYRDYGWERHQSALPEFRDPTIRFMPYERETPRTLASIRRKENLRLAGFFRPRR